MSARPPPARALTPGSTGEIVERFLYWTLFAAGVALASWLPATSAYPELARLVPQMLMRVLT